MKLKQLELKLKNLQITYQVLIDKYLPKSGDLNEIEDEKKMELIKLNKKLVSLRQKISSIKGEEEESEEYLKYLNDLKEKFKD